MNKFIIFLYLTVCYGQTGFFTNEDEKSSAIFGIMTMDMDKTYLHNSNSVKQNIGLATSYFKDDLEFEAYIWGNGKDNKNYGGINYHVKGKDVSFSVGFGKGKYDVVNRSVSKMSLYIQREWIPFITFTIEKESRSNSYGSNDEYPIIEFGVYKELDWANVGISWEYEERYSTSESSIGNGSLKLTIGKVFHR